MSDDAKLGLMAGVLAVVGVAAFALPRDGNATPKPEATISSKTATPPVQPPAAMPTSAVRK